MSGLRISSVFCVVMLVLASISPCAALVGRSNSSSNLTDVPCGGDGCGPSPGQRDLRVFPVAGVVVAEYVITNAELIALLVTSGGAIVGYATVSVNHHDYADVIDHWNDLVNHVTSLWDAINGRATAATDYAGHLIEVYSTAALEFSSVEQRYNTAKAAKESYEDSKRKGIPVPGNNKGEARHDVDPNWKTPLSSYQLFHNDVDRDNGCPKQIRYFNEKGERDLDIDFYHGKATDEITGLPVTFPHKHIWWSNGQRGGHNYEGIQEIIDNWRCKNYDFEKSKWRW